jgi:chromate reductase
MSKLLGLCGSLRSASLNAKLLQEAGHHYDGTLTVGDLRLPLYDGDLEDDGLPDPVAHLAQQIAEADAVAIACPEYNKAPPGVLKNALDWISRAPGGVLAKKPVAIMSAAAGRAGGERTQYMLRLMLVPFKADVLTGPEVLVASAAQQFDEDGRLTNEINLKALIELMTDLRTRAS